MSKKNIIILVIAVALAVLGVFFINTRDSKNVVEAPSVEKPEDIIEPVEPAEEPAEEPEMPTEQADASGIVAGKPAPDFTLINMNGEEVKLSDYQGKLVYLNFWATWCGYCDQEMPDLQALNVENDDLVVLAVNVREDKDTVQPYLDKGGYDFPVLLDEEGEIATKYLVAGMPTTYFINSEGILLDRYPGMMEKDQMEEILGKMRELEN